MSYRRRHINPKIHKLKPKKRLTQRPIFWFFLLIIIIVPIVWTFLFLAQFQVAHIKVSGSQKVPSNQIENIAWQNINKNIMGMPYKSIFTVDSDVLKKHILTGFSGIEDVKIKKNYFTSIDIQVVERTPFAVFCPDFIKDSLRQNYRDQNQATNNCFTTDRNGVIYENLENITGGSLIMRQVVDQNLLVAGQRLIDKNIIDIISKIQGSLKNNFQIDIKEVMISNTLIFNTSETWQLYFNPKQNIDLQIAKMNILLKDEITVSARKNLKYIYLQYKDRVYYR